MMMLCNLPLDDGSGRVRKYLSSIIKAVRGITGHPPASIILFGSVIRAKRLSYASDIDTLIVLPDAVSFIQRQKLSRYMVSLQRIFIKAGGPGLIEKILGLLEQSAGMFKSFFICSETELLSADFNRIFGVNRVLAALFAPKKLVLNSVLRGSMVVYGKSYDHVSLTPRIDYWEIVKSYMLCSLLGLSSMLIMPFTAKADKYIYESIKWSLLNAYYYLKRRIVPFNSMIRFFEKILGGDDLLRVLKDYRSKGIIQRNLLPRYFSIIFKIHFSSTSGYLKR